jgi:hypothetical protein
MWGRYTAAKDFGEMVTLVKLVGVILRVTFLHQLKSVVIQQPKHRADRT